MKRFPLLSVLFFLVFSAHGINANSYAPEECSLLPIPELTDHSRTGTPITGFASVAADGIVHHFAGFELEEEVEDTEENPVNPTASTPKICTSAVLLNRSFQPLPTVFERWGFFVPPVSRTALYQVYLI